MNAAYLVLGVIMPVGLAVVGTLRLLAEDRHLQGVSGRKKPGSIKAELQRRAVAKALAWRIILGAALICVSLILYRLPWKLSAFVAGLTTVVGYWSLLTATWSSPSARLEAEDAAHRFSGAIEEEEEERFIFKPEPPREQRTVQANSATDLVGASRMSRSG